MTMDISLPPDFQPLLAELAAAPDNVRAMWRYALVLIMIDDEKARVIANETVDGQELLTVRTNAGDVFQIVRPEMSEATEKLLMQQVREIVAENLSEEDH